MSRASVITVGLGTVAWVWIVGAMSSIFSISVVWAMLITIVMTAASLVLEVVNERLKNGLRERVGRNCRLDSVLYVVLTLLWAVMLVLTFHALMVEMREMGMSLSVLHILPALLVSGVFSGILMFLAETFILLAWRAGYWVARTKVE